MTIVRRVSGDVNDTFKLHLHGVSSLATATTVVCHVQRRSATVVTLTGSVFGDPDDCIVEIDCSTSSWLATAPAGTYDLETQVTFVPPITKTWPEQGKDKLIITRQLA